MIRYFVGLDLGQRVDYTAIAVVEREEPVTARFDYVAWLHRQTKWEATFAVRFVERIALGTAYPAVVRRVREIVTAPELRGRCCLVIDGTGVGRPIVDLLREARLDCALVPVLITSGMTAHSDGGIWNVPKRDLIAAVQVLIEQGRLRFAAGLPKTKTLLDELMAMRVRVNGPGREQYGAWRESTHDDLALAVAMACWRAKGDERTVGEQSGRLF